MTVNEITGKRQCFLIRWARNKHTLSSCPPPAPKLGGQLLPPGPPAPASLISYAFYTNQWWDVSARAHVQTIFRILGIAGRIALKFGVWLWIN